MQTMRWLLLVGLMTPIFYSCFTPKDDLSSMSSAGEIAMASQSMPCDNSEFSVFEQELTAAIAAATSLDEIYTWLNQHNIIDSVSVSDYIIKTEPPQREFNASYRLAPDTLTPIIIDVLEFSDDQFQLSEVRFVTCN